MVAFVSEYVAAARTLDRVFVDFVVGFSAASGWHRGHAQVDPSCGLVLMPQA